MKQKILNHLKSCIQFIKGKYHGVTVTHAPYALDAEHFQSASDEMLDFMWGQAVDTGASLERSYRINKENSDKLLNLLLAGVGGAALLLINSAQHAQFLLGLIILILGWTGCALILIKKCVETKKRYILTHSPEDIYINDNSDPSIKMELPKIRRYILYNMAETIYEMEWLVGETAKGLNGVRKAAAYVAITAAAGAILNYMFI